MKIKRTLPYSYYTLLVSYLIGRFFQIKLDGNVSEFYSAKVGVPQDSVLGPLLFLMYTHDLRVETDVEDAALADTALLASDNDPVAAAEKLQVGLNDLEKWARQ